MSTEIKTGPKYRYHGVKGTFLHNTYEVRRADEREPFAIVEQLREGGWNEEPRWQAKSIADDTVSASGTSRERAVSSLAFRLLPTEEQERQRAEANAAWEAEQNAIVAAIEQRELEALHSPEHQSEALVEAFHVLFDIKDAAPPRDYSNTEHYDVGTEAWYTLQALGRLFHALGIEKPKRYDNDGRTVENGGLS